MTFPLEQDGHPFARPRVCWLLLASCAALLASCFSLPDSAQDWSSPAWSDPPFRSLDQPLSSALSEEFRQQWLHIAPEQWRKRVVGLRLGNKNDEVLLDQQERWVLLLGRESEQTNQQDRVIAFIGRLVALETSQVKTIYFYPPIHDPALQQHYLNTDLARVPTTSFLLFQPEMGRSVIPFDDSLIARYVAKFYPGTSLVGFSTNDLTPAPKTDPIDDFVASWLAMVFNSPTTGRRREKVEFLHREEPLNRLAQQIRQLARGYGR